MITRPSFAHRYCHAAATARYARMVRYAHAQLIIFQCRCRALRVIQGADQWREAARWDGRLGPPRGRAASDLGRMRRRWRRRS
jgi:hypothetical protein